MKYFTTIIFSLFFIGIYGQVVVYPPEMSIADSISLDERMNDFLKEQNQKFEFELIDSVSFSFQLDQYGAPQKIVLQSGGYPVYIEWAQKTILQSNWQNSDPIDSAFIVFQFGPQDPESFTIEEVNSFPNADSLEEDLTKKELYFRSAYIYYIDKQFQELINNSFFIQNNIEGEISLDIIFDIYGKVDFLKIDYSTTNPAFYSYVLNKLNQFQIDITNLAIDKQLVPLAYSKTYKSKNYGKELDERWDKGLKLYQQNKFTDAFFEWSSLLNKEYELDSTRYYKMGRAAYLSNNPFDKNNTQFLFESMYDLNWEKYELTYNYSQWSEQEFVIKVKKKEKQKKNKAKSEDADLETSKPYFDNCADKPSEERFQCFQRELMLTISSNFIYPQKCRDEGISGKVYVSFVIEKDGSVSSLRVERSVHTLLDLEALRLISLIPKSNPAILKGEPVRMSYTIPINFRLK